MDKTAIIFDIQRFSLNDGPGIRTTVFIKGCPLHCAWCHNPESQNAMPSLGYNKEKCMLCSKCQTVCKNNVHSFLTNKNSSLALSEQYKNLSDTHKVSFKKCVMCGNCIDNCPYEALYQIGKEMSIKEICDIVMKDCQYYKNSKGGVTISGGEPLYHQKLILSLLKSLKKFNLHIAIETSGYCNPNTINAVLPFCDLFLFDYKMSDKESHRKYIGFDNEIILQNLDIIATKGNDIILRCPIIQNLNDNDYHFKKIAELYDRYSRIKKVELMPYHNMGKHKAEQIGKEYIINTDIASKEQIANWEKIIQKYRQCKIE